MRIALSAVATELLELADRPTLSEAEEWRWQRLVREWDVLQQRLEEGKN